MRDDTDLKSLAHAHALENMNAAHVHLISNVVPIYGAMLTALFLLAALVGRHRDAWTRAALATLALSVAGGIVAFLSGISAENVIDGLPHTSGKALSEHHVRSIIGASFLVLAGIVAIVVAMRARRHGGYTKGLLLAVLIPTLIAAGTLAWTGLAGGRIGHPELQTPADREHGPARPH